MLCDKHLPTEEELIGSPTLPSRKSNWLYSNRRHLYCVRFLKRKGEDKTVHVREEFLCAVRTEITTTNALSETF